MRDCLRRLPLIADFAALHPGYGKDDGEKENYALRASAPSIMSTVFCTP